MISEVVMPQMGADMTEGTVVRWLKHEGDRVERGEIIAEIETDKANVEVEAFESGVFRAAIAQEGDTVPVGEVIAIIAAPEDDISKYINGAGAATKKEGRGAPSAVAANGGADTQATPYAARAPAPARPVREPQPEALQTPVTAGEPAARLRVSPVARRIADELGVDVRQVRGSGPGGRIVKRDIEAAARRGALAPAAPAREPAGPQQREQGAIARPGVSPRPAVEAADQVVVPSRMRQAIARRMSQSKREAPHYYLLLDIDMTDALAFREQVNASVDEARRVSINDLIVRACALALQRHPEFNATIEGDQVTQRAEAHICIGIALDDGLIAPAIVGSGRMSLLEIAAASKDLIARAKGGALRQEELTAGTFTISNLGAYGVETLVAIIQPPQTAILGVGAVKPQPAVRDGQVTARQIMKVALSADHRVTDGAQGARFLAEVERLLEQPVSLIL
jgi:pyruvate dehydrogenase E2 component (dihydrolipoamide acetyltransferase)